jgi:thioredoxin 1
MSDPINISGKIAFDKVVMQSKLPVLVDFWAPWCMPCRMMAPVLEELAKEYEGKLIVAKVDTENSVNQELAFEYQIQSIPNMKLFKDGKVVQDFIGFRPKQAFSEELKKFV